MRKDLVAPSSIYSLKKVIKIASKDETLKLHMFIVNFVKEGVGKRFFDLSSFYIDIKFHVKIVSSLALSSSKCSRYQVFLCLV